jgi:uncharacterized protein YdeI (YjbR/CyaY-like superfamily)
MNKPSKHDSYPIILFKTQDEFEEWLSKEHDKAPGVWLKFAKKGSGVTSTNYAESLDVALCYGWIDGQSKKFDDTFYLQKFTPRGKRSIWSKINKGHVARLIKDKRMQPAGMAAIEAAKKDGRWDLAYDSPKDMKIPKDFMSEVERDKKRLAFFNTLNKTNRYAIAWRLQTAKKPETRERRMQVLLSMLDKGEKLH